MLGEDVLDPYGGAFKVTHGLSTAYPERVLATPISEAGIVGVASGMALRGLRPIVEIMFGDFVTLIADQLINHAAKFRWMYGDGLETHAPIRVPMVVRTPMGGRRGYGPTHSQTLEKLFLGVPGLRVIAANNFHDPGGVLYRTILETEDPVLFVENKLLYLLPLHDETSLAEFDLSPAGETTVRQPCRLTLRGAPAPTISIAAYGYMAELARQAVLRLGYEHEIFAELLIPTELTACDLLPSTENLLSVEEGTCRLGWGAEVLARASESMGGRLKAARRVAACELPVPASGALEQAALPGVEQIVQAARMMV